MYSNKLIQWTVVRHAVLQGFYSYFTSASGSLISSVATIHLKIKSLLRTDLDTKEEKLQNKACKKCGVTYPFIGEKVLT